MPTALIVDDCAPDRRLAGGLLEKDSDLEVLYAADGLDALNQIRQRPPDVVISDLNMPNLDGLELVSTLKREYPAVPVVLMTAQGSEEIAVRALQEGAASYVPKRRLAAELLETVGRVLSATHAVRTHARLMRRITEYQATFELENDLELLTSLVGHLQQSLAEMDLCDQSERIRVGVALQEALINAYFHGNLEVCSSLRESDHRAYYDLARERSHRPPYSQRRIHVTVRVSRGEVLYTIRDEGPGFDPATLPNPTDPDQLERPCGRGLLLMRTFMDEVRYSPTGNEVTMRKCGRTNGCTGPARKGIVS